MSGQTTSNLGIPLLQGDQPFVRQQINAALEKIDEAAVSVKHESSKAHFELWQKNTAYGLNDTVRVSSSPSWQVLVCVTAGSSGAVEPVAAGIGDYIPDGNIVWKSAQIAGDSGGITAWQSGAVYVAKNMVIYNKKIYRCLAAHTSTSTFDAAKWEEISASITPWRQGSLYSANDFVTYDNKLYMCLTGHISTASLDYAKWQLVGGTVEDWQPDTMYQQNVLVAESSILYRCKSSHTSNTTSFDNDIPLYWEELGTSIRDWQVGRYYRAGSLSIYAGKTYQCLTTHTATDFESDFAKWLLLAASILQDWQPSTGYKQAESVIYNNRIYACTAEHVSGNSWQASLWRKVGLDITDWQIGEVYNAGDFVLQDNLLYQCLAAHTSVDFAADISNWRQITIGYVPVWTAEVYYTKYQVVTRGSSILRCIVPHTAEPTFSNTERNNWEVIAGKGAVIPEWQPSTEYGIDEAVIYNDVIYLANTNHISSATFAADMIAGFEKWRAVGGNGGAAGELMQVTKLGVLATKVVELVINYTDTFTLPPLEVLKFEPGEQDQIVTLCAFDNTDADDFVFDNNYVEFDGAMQLKTRINIPMSEPVALGDGFISESDEIDFALYKNVNDVSVG